MSESVLPREWRFYIDDMIGFCERVQLFTAGIAKSHCHGYLGIDNDTLWSIVQTDIPVLLASLRQLKIKVP